MGQFLRVLEAQGPIGKQYLEAFKRARPDRMALIETALRAVPLH
jgi:hypothetical protein